MFTLITKIKNVPLRALKSGKTQCLTQGEWTDSLLGNKINMAEKNIDLKWKVKNTK